MSVFEPRLSSFQLQLLLSGPWLTNAAGFTQVKKQTKQKNKNKMEEKIKNKQKTKTKLFLLVQLNTVQADHSSFPLEKTNKQKTRPVRNSCVE